MLYRNEKFPAFLYYHEITRNTFKFKIEKEQN